MIHVQTLLSKVVGDNHGYHTQNGFNDLGFYMSLRDAYGENRVEIGAIDIFHNILFIHGIRVKYRVKYSNEAVTGIEGPSWQIVD